MRRARGARRGPRAALGVAMADEAARDGDADELATQLADIGATLTLKAGPLFLLADSAGEIGPQTAPGRDRGLGLYFRDCAISTRRRCA